MDRRGFLGRVIAGELLPGVLVAGEKVID